MSILSSQAILYSYGIIWSCPLSNFILFDDTTAKKVNVRLAQSLKYLFS